ncbi:MAG: RHS repeat-associated core domain-containing protein [Gemmataceae bacterium]
METSTYDAAGQLIRRVLTDGNRTVRLDQAWTAAGRLESVARYADAAGTVSVGDSAFSYDDAGRTTSLTHRDGASVPIASFTYSYDLAGRVTQETTDGQTTVYHYDATDQLTGAGGETFTYDATGNRTQAGYLVGASNRLLSDGTWSYQYDAEGNRVSQTRLSDGLTWSYGYDLRNQLVSAEQRQADGTLALQLAYAYDADGQRIQTTRQAGTASATVQRVAYDGDAVWADLDGLNTLTTRYLLTQEEAPAARLDGAAVTAWLLTDRLGSVRAVTDATGTVQDRLDYSAFGQVSGATHPTWSGRFRYTGQAWDADTGWQEHHWRWYDPTVGQWTTEDPLGFAAGDVHLRRYVGNNATNATDPSGLLETHTFRLDLKRRDPLAYQYLFEHTEGTIEHPTQSWLSRFLCQPGIKEVTQEQGNLRFVISPNVELDEAWAFVTGEVRKTDGWATFLRQQRANAGEQRRKLIDRLERLAGKEVLRARQEELYAEYQAGKAHYLFAPGVSPWHEFYRMASLEFGKDCEVAGSSRPPTAWDSPEQLNRLLGPGGTGEGVLVAVGTGKVVLSGVQALRTPYQPTPTPTIPQIGSREALIASYYQRQQVEGSNNPYQALVPEKRPSSSKEISGRDQKFFGLKLVGGGSGEPEAGQAGGQQVPLLMNRQTPLQRMAAEGRLLPGPVGNAPQNSVPTTPRPGRMHVEPVELSTGKGRDFVIPGSSVPERFSARLMDGSGTLQVTWTDSLRQTPGRLGQAQKLAGGPGSFSRITGRASADLEAALREGQFNAEQAAQQLGNSLGGKWRVDVTRVPGSQPPVFDITATRIGN